MSSLDDILAFLAQPETYGVAGPVERLETHSAYVFLAGERAYKIKKRVDFPYMDFSTLEKRRAACMAELEINRRTAPDLYLAVQPVTDDGALHLGGAAAAAVEWVVVMRRFPQEALFDRLAARGALSPELMDGLADAVVALHEAAERSVERGGKAAFGRYVEGNAAELERAIGDVFEARPVARANQGCRAALERLGDRLDQRRAAGWVRRCHGDLHLRNICLIDGAPTLFDAIEFNEDFAVIDILYDLAFLLMDLDHRGLAGHANRLLNRYLSHIGYDGLAALPFMMACRAIIRAHVTGRLAEGQEDGAAAAGEARGYLDRALSYLSPAPARLIAVGGISGSGKSTLARALAPCIGAPPGAVVLRSDVIRKRLYGVAETERLPAAAYEWQVSVRVFAEIERRAEQVLRQGHAVIADAVYGNDGQRDGIAAVAGRLGVPFDGVWLEAPAAVLEQRVDARRGDASDATAAVVRAQLSGIRPPRDWHRLDSSAGPDSALRAARQALGA
ncbi:bifunctional aminoglycoside phosphotransferase/ATP-binding protein [Oceanibaculum pacificum]|uniref:Aminoglycoside phosphotransferase domain-containing protein n=1 Tax=Oceanibaculum pacificum TaxID=580166 RepID=A0A154WA01_9PROT|nr:bifunctional aminoglycoside phosphotransferase/ATP-binding protein [Oceanibaculum pacificum]KZD10316.1 hypothetical protein AUP43_06240 [Oceanibaculum pacificum]